jgi:hypothetical protein
MKDVASLAGVAVGPGVPTAAFCTNDLLALGLLRRLPSSAIRSRGTWPSSATTTSTSRPTPPYP